MQINDILITGFRGIHFFSLAPDHPTVVVFGPNGAGKSSIRYAIQLALFGRCPLTDKRGGGMKDLICHGVKEASIHIKLDSHEITLTITPREVDTCIVNSQGEVITRDEFWTAVGIDPRYAAICCMPEQYLHSKELGDVLSEFLGGDVKNSDIEKLIGEDNAKKVREWAASNDCDWDAIEKLEALGQKAYAVRTETNRRIKEIDAELALLGHCPLPVDKSGKPIPTDKMHVLRDHIAKLNKQRDALMQELGAAGTESAYTASDIEAMQADAAALKAEVDRLDAARMKIADKLGKAVIEHSTAVNAFNLLDKEAEPLDMAVRRANEAIAAITTLDKCPTCQRSITAAVRKSIIGPLEQAYEDAKAAYAPVLEKCHAADDVVTRTRDAAEALRTQEAEIKTALADARAKHSELAAILRNVPAFQARSEADIRTELDAVETSIARTQAAIESLTKACDKQALTLQKTDLESEVLFLGQLVRWFRDGEITKQLVSGGLTDFESRCNAELIPFGLEFSAAVTGKSIVLNLNGTPVAQCSQGEQALACYAVARAFANSGSLILLDDINDLDARNRAKVLGRLKDTPGAVWCFAAWQQSAAWGDAHVAALAPLHAVWMGGAVASEVA